MSKLCWWSAFLKRTRVKDPRQGFSRLTNIILQPKEDCVCGFRISSLLFERDLVLLASSSNDLNLALGQFAAYCSAEEFEWPGVLSMNEGRREWEFIAVMWMLCQSAFVKGELGMKAKLSIYWLMYFSALTYSHKLWVEISFLPRVSVCPLR